MLDYPETLDYFNSISFIGSPHVNLMFILPNKTAVP